VDYTILGRTGLKVSVAGLGCGGPSRLGLRDDGTEKEAIALVRQALDAGVNLLDTAEAYGTEAIVGKAVKGLLRERVFISTKKTPPHSRLRNPGKELRKGLEQSLRRLKADYVDIYHLHGVEPKDYTFALERLVPELFRLRDEGKIRFLGITEAFAQDPRHRMLEQALKDDCWDVVMVGFNILNQSARREIFEQALRKNVGVLVMFAVRRVLSQPARLEEVWTELKQKGLVDPDLHDVQNPLDFLLEQKIVSTIPEAAYRYCRHEPGVHVVLTGTGNPDHLRANLESLVKPALPEAALRRLGAIFERVDNITGS